ncbi:tyrosine-type recombinase/integrase [Burkholderia gladioli]|uniref:tyrosine-type recombinase/integrase n=1 Tax=Burkholderia gladioli TaxID=28095 RepID=UPI001FC8AF9F|nr:site-specific integrase [Burkholderia gladioli]MDZ4041539.1 site-specific integrase [Burkholderia gladioli pv. alliicola]
MVPLTPRAEAKFGTEPGSAVPVGYSVRGAAGVLAWLLERLQVTMTDLSEPERRQLAQTSPHSLRHTFGTQAVASGMALDVVQQLLGHASLQTTSVYVTAEQRRRRIEAAKFHAAVVGKRLGYLTRSWRRARHAPACRRRFRSASNWPAGRPRRSAPLASRSRSWRW